MTVHQYKNWGDNLFFSDIQLLGYPATFINKESEAQVTWCAYLEGLGWLPLRKDSAFLRVVILALTKLLAQPQLSNQLPSRLRKFI